MRSIDRKWVDLYAGYQDIQSYKTKLTAEFGRAVRVGHHLQYRKELTEWQKKRRVFFALVAATPLSIITLCLTAYYFREVACVIVYWAILVVIILVTLAVAGRQYIREMVNGKPIPQTADGLLVDLEERWWENLSPHNLVDVKSSREHKRDFQSLLSQSLTDDYSFRFFSDSDAILLGTTGIWIFRVVNWNGTMVKQGGTWTQIVTTRDKLGRKQREEKSQVPGPDDQWLQCKQEVLKKIENTVPDLTRTQDLIKGGVVFSHPKVNLDKSRIQDNLASYGRPKAWVGRIRSAPAVEGFTQEVQLEILDVLADPDAEQPISAKDEAERLYHLAVEELQATVAKMVK
jgi:hypothetical protein